MKHFKKIPTLFVLIFLLLGACTERPKQTAEDKQREAQQAALDLANDQVGMPSIINYRQKRMMKKFQEDCDRKVVTYAYFENAIPVKVPGFTALGGKLTFISVCESYPVPYAAQFTAPESMQTYNIHQKPGETVLTDHYGVARLPQADPDGLHKPTSSEASVTMMKDPTRGSDKVGPAYSEPRLFVVPFKLPMD